MHATFRQFKKCKTFAGVDPLNKTAADNKIFPAGLFLMNGWLFMVTVTAGLFNTYESSHLLGNLTTAKLMT